MLRNVLIFHSGALGDLVLSFPLALALTRLYPTSRVRYVTTSDKGRLAAKMVGVEWVDVETGLSPSLSGVPNTSSSVSAGAVAFTALYSADVEPGESVRRLLGSAHRIISYTGEAGDVWSKRVRELAPTATLTYLTTRPEAAATPPVHAIDHLLRQCAAVDRGGDAALAGAVEQIVALLRKQGLLRRVGVDSGGRGVVMHPGAGSPAKCWPVDHFRELALRLRDSTRDEVRWVLGEVELERMPSGERRALDALGDVVVPTGLLGLLEEVLSARVFVGNDSGPGHVAAMAGVPTVSLFGPTDAAVWAPVGPRVLAVRGGEGRMENLAVEAVLAAVQQV